MPPFLQKAQRGPTPKMRTGLGRDYDLQVRRRRRLQLRHTVAASRFHSINRMFPENLATGGCGNNAILVTEPPCAPAAGASCQQLLELTIILLNRTPRQKPVLLHCCGARQQCIANPPLSGKYIPADGQGKPTSSAQKQQNCRLQGHELDALPPLGIFHEGRDFQPSWVPSLRCGKGCRRYRSGRS